jgi:tetratricopeptide (TPR) repeat protein
MALNKNEPVYYEELDALYEMSNAPVGKRLKLFEGNNEVVSKRDDAFARQITVLTLAGKPEKSVEYLTGRKFSYREGSSRVRDILIDAHLMLGKKYMAEKNFNKALEEFLLAQVPEEEAGGSRSGNRNLQVDYFIGSAYEAMGNKSKADKYYSSSTAQESRSSSYIRYYQGLSYSGLGKKKDADNAFNAIIAEGERQVKQSASNEVDFFAKFGEKEAENARLSNAYLLKGLGNKGLGNKAEAKANLQKAVELSASNLYAATELQDI